MLHQALFAEGMTVVHTRAYRFACMFYANSFRLSGGDLCNRGTRPQELFRENATDADGFMRPKKFAKRLATTEGTYLNDRLPVHTYAEWKWESGCKKSQRKDGFSNSAPVAVVIHAHI